MVKNVLLALLLGTAAAANAGVTAIRDVRLFDGANVVPSATVVFEDGVILAAGRGVPVPDGATIVDGSGKTLLPGLIDAHTHVFGNALERALRFGVTTELDMFTSADLARRLRAEQKTGPVTGRADIVSAGTLVTVKGGHGTEYMPIPTFEPGSDAETFIDARIAEGSDYIKLVYDDGSAFGIDWNTLARRDLEALIAAAHARGKLAVVHTSTLGAAREALEAGADGLIHLFAIPAPDPEFGRFVAERGAFVIPTLTVIESTTGVPSGTSLANDARLRPYLTSEERGALGTSFPANPRSGSDLRNAFAATRQLREAKVPILAGTDAPNPGTTHGASIHRELELLVAAGLTPLEALAAATSTPAKVFGLEDRGRIAKGKKADLVLVEGDPTRDITATRAIASVWKSGALLAREPEREEAAVSVDASALEDGVIAGFESGEPTSRIGAGFQASTDAMIGGKSEASMEVVEGGAAGSAKSLLVRAQTKPGAPFPWAGAMITLGPTPMAPVDLSSKKGIRFFAKGDTELRVMAFAKSAGRIPRMKTVRAGADWTEIAIPWSDFQLDGSDVQGLLFAGPDGSVEFRIDELRLD